VPLYFGIEVKSHHSLGPLVYRSNPSKSVRTETREHRPMHSRSRERALGGYLNDRMLVIRRLNPINRFYTSMRQEGHFHTEFPGIAWAHEVFDRNRQDRTTVAEMLDRLEKRIGPQPGATVVVDRSMAYEEDLEAIRAHGYHYLVPGRNRFPLLPAPVDWNYPRPKPRRISGRAALPVCTAGHHPGSIATLRLTIAQVLLRWLKGCPYCGTPCP